MRRFWFVLLIFFSNAERYQSISIWKNLKSMRNAKHKFWPTVVEQTVARSWGRFRKNCGFLVVGVYTTLTIMIHYGTKKKMNKLNKIDWKNVMKILTSSIDKPNFFYAKEVEEIISSLLSCRNINCNRFSSAIEFTLAKKNC